MKKFIYGIIIAFTIFCLSGCGYYNSYYYITLKNETGEQITVRILEDSETKDAVTHGVQDQTVTLKVGKKVITDVVNCSAFMIFVNDTPIHEKRPSGEIDTAETNAGYHFFRTGCHTTIIKEEDTFYYKLIEPISGMQV